METFLNIAGLFFMVSGMVAWAVFIVVIFLVVFKKGGLNV
jgi:hypothetical protein